MKNILIALLLVLCGTSTTAQNDTLLVAYTPAPPFVITDTNSLEGISIYLWEQIAKELDIVYQYVPMPFTDMLQALEAGTIDVSINPLTITSERNKKIDFTHPFYITNSTVVIHQASPLSRFFQFLKSLLNMNFLRGLIALLLIIGTFGVLMWHFEKRINPLQFRPTWEGIWDGIWWSMVTMTTVGYGDKTPKSRGGKIVALIWMFSGLLFISGFTASIASTLTVKQLSSGADSVQEFKEKKVGSIGNSSSLHYLKDHFFRNVVFYDNTLMGLKDVQAHKIDAFVYDAPILKYRLMESVDLQDLEVLPIQFNQQFYAFGLPKNTDALKNKISQELLEQITHTEWRFILSEYNLSEL